MRTDEIFQILKVIKILKAISKTIKQPFVVTIKYRRCHARISLLHTELLHCHSPGYG